MYNDNNEVFSFGELNDANSFPTENEIDNVDESTNQDEIVESNNASNSIFESTDFQTEFPFDQGNNYVESQNDDGYNIFSADSSDFKDSAPVLNNEVESELPAMDSDVAPSEVQLEDMNSVADGYNFNESETVNTENLNAFDGLNDLPAIDLNDSSNSISSNSELEDNVLNDNLDNASENEELQDVSGNLGTDIVDYYNEGTDNLSQENVEPSTNELVENEDISYEETENYENSDDKVEISDTPIEEINKLTEYEDDGIETTDIATLFDKVNVNFKEASDIFRKNTEMKEKIDSKFDDLKKLQSELDIKKKTQIDEINEYKEEVYSKLTQSKEEIEKRLTLLKEQQASFEKSKMDFEEYKKSETDNIERIKREVQTAYDERREELNHVEDVLRKQKDLLDEERNQLTLDKIQYESDKNELANNLLKFNELVNQFTSGVGSLPNE